jgi:hypothetical protein
MSNAGDYTYWRNALNGDFGPVHDGDVQCGFWRKRIRSGGGFLPVAIWRTHAKEIRAVVDGYEQEHPENLWTFICRYPVTEEQYRARVETGVWHDEDSAIAASAQPPSIGHNEGPQDEAEILKGQIEAASANAKDYETISDDGVAAKAQSARSRLLELAGEAEKKHKKEKQPFLDGGRDVDKKWFALRDAAKSMADKLRAAMSAHETAKAAVEAKARAEALQKAREGEEAARKAAEAGGPIPAPAAPPPPVEPIPAASMTLRGAYGKAASIRTVRVVTVTDQDLVYRQFRDHADVGAILTRLAQKATDSGLTVAGVSVEEKKDVR